MYSESDAITSSRRDESSLYTLTRKFITLLCKCPDQHINITQAAEALSVGKRRIYDITNVLEGLGLVSKWSVNSVKWTGPDIEEIIPPGGDGAVLNRVSCEKANEEGQLDDEIAHLNDEIATLSIQKKNLENAYVTYEDLQRLKIFKDQLVFALKAPPDSEMEYPRYSKGAYYLVIYTDSGKICVYYVNSDKQIY